MQRFEMLGGQLAKRMAPFPSPRPELLINTNGIYLGKLKHFWLPFFWDYRKLVNPHIAVFGVSGSGKSHLIKTFLTRARIAWGANALVLDWTGEYAEWVRQSGGSVIRLGEESINLMDCFGMRPVDRARQIMVSLEILSGLQNPAEKRLIEAAILEAYAKRMPLAEQAAAGTQAPTLMDVQVELSGKNGEAADMAKWRIGQFIRPGNDYFSRQSTCKLESLLTGFVCVDLHSLPSEENRSMAAQAILQFARERMRSQTQELGTGRIKLFIVADEAWKIARDERSELIAIAREGRKYNFGLIVASQNPTDVHKDILSNVATCVVMRLLLEEQRRYVGESLGFSQATGAECERFGVGGALFALVFVDSRAHNTHFIINKIDGEELLERLSLKVIGGGGHMELEFVKNEFRRKLAKFGMSNEQIGLICGHFDANGHEMDVLEFVNYLERFGFAKSSIMFMLRELGIRDGQLVDVFSMLQRKRLNLYGDSMVALEINEAKKS